MSSRDGVIERIRKLMALAEDEGATEAEAAAGALMAQRLIAENDIEQWELHSSQEEPIEGHESAPARSRWRWQLAGVVAPGFRCRHYNSRKWDRAKREYVQRMVFYGYRTDAKAAAITFDFLYRVGCRLARRASRGKPPGTYNAYVLGYVEGIKGELEKQAEALMIVVPPKVEESYERFSVGFGKASSELSYGAGHEAMEAYERGVAEGRDAVRARRMGAAGDERGPEAAALPGAMA